ncbi:MAG: hypothetical protein KGD64_00140 [Candidatus Heimdallarchaeota archaeon]|nr:hypothetical protein [Candidatus Heimdallarchaeota archaeon]
MATSYLSLLQKTMQFSLIPKEFLYKIILGKIKRHSKDFISERDLTKIIVFSNLSILNFLLSIVLCYFLIQLNIIFTLLVSIVIALSFFFVTSDYIRSNIMKRHHLFDEMAFLIINSLSINMKSTQSLPQSIELLLKKRTVDNFYKEYFEEMVFKFNVGADEDRIIDENSRMFQNKKHRYAFQNLKNPVSFIETDPDFLIKLKREVKLIEDNMVIFVAISCLLPLVLSLVLSLIVAPTSPTLLLFPFLYAVFGTATLRLIQNKSMEGKNV